MKFKLKEDIGHDRSFSPQGGKIKKTEKGELRHVNESSARSHTVFVYESAILFLSVSRLLLFRSFYFSTIKRDVSARSCIFIPLRL